MLSFSHTPVSLILLAVIVLVPDSEVVFSTQAVS